MEEEVPVREVDQENICKFSILAEELKELKAEIKQLEEEKRAIDDVEDEMLLSEDLRAGEGIFFRVADAFIELPDELLSEKLKSTENTVSSQLAKLKERLHEVTDQLSRLKAELYGRFRNQIALEFE